MGASECARVWLRAVPKRARTVVAIVSIHILSYSHCPMDGARYIFAGAGLTTGPVIVGSTTGIPTAEQTTSIVFIIPSMCAIWTSLYACTHTAQGKRRKNMMS